MTSLATLVDRCRDCLATSTTNRPATSSSWSTSLDRHHQHPVHPRHRRHLAAADPAHDADRAAGDHLLVEPLPRAQGIPRAFLMLILVLHTGMIGTFVAQDLILFFVFFEVVLLPMYFMIGVWGGPERQYASHQVLPVHAVRLGADDRQLPGAVLPRRGRAPSTCACSRPVAARGIAPHHPAVDLRWHVPRVRHQGADVPVPHLAARCPHPGADPGLGHPGCRPAEARHLRLRPDRHPDPARGRGRVGAMDRAAGGHRHHLRRARLPGPDRHEAPHRLLVGGAHGLRDAGHRHA